MKSKRCWNSLDTSAQAPLQPASGAALQIGAVKLRLRQPRETLAPERPLPALGHAQLAPLLGLGLLVMLLALADHWALLDPGADATAWLPIAVGVPLALAGWCGAWALVSKLFQHRFDFMGHLRIVLPWLLAIEVLDLLLTALGAALAWPWLWRLAVPLQVLLGVLMLRAHLTQVLPLSGRIVTAVVAAAALVGTAISITLTQRATDRPLQPPGLHEHAALVSAACGRHRPGGDTGAGHGAVGIEARAARDAGACRRRQ